LDSSPSESSIFEPPSTIHHRLQLGRSSFPQLCTFLLRTCHSPAPPPPVLGSVLSCQPSPSVLSVPGPLLGLTYGTYLHQGRTKSGDVRACVRAFRKELGNATQRRKKKTQGHSHTVLFPCRVVTVYRSSLARLVATLAANRFIHHHLVGVRFDQTTTNTKKNKKHHRLIHHTPLRVRQGSCLFVPLVVPYILEEEKSLASQQIFLSSLDSLTAVCLLH
jgi:hypothetical protein